MRTGRTRDDLAETGWLSAEAIVLARQKMYPEARAASERILPIAERVLGSSHPELGAVLEGRALLLAETGDSAGAKAAIERALSIREKALGSSHPLVASTINNQQPAAQG